MDCATIDRTNRTTVEARDAWHAAVAAGTAASDEWQKLKHAHPYVGHVELDFAGTTFVLYSANDDVVAWECFWTGSYEPRTVAAWMERSQGAEVILDIGAYTGCMSIAAAIASPSTIVHAFEAMPRTAERYAINAKVNRVLKRTHLHVAAVSDAPGRVTMNMPRNADFLGTGNSVFDKPNVPTITTIDVAAVRVDDVIGDLGGRIALVKLDVEGHEAAALRGMAATIGRHRPALIVEVWRHEKDEIAAYFDGIGYAGHHLDGMNWLYEPR